MKPAPMRLLSRTRLLLLVLIFAGTLFQGVAMFKSGQVYSFGVGYWGPLARDGVWHEALVKSLFRSIPPENPGLSGSALVNYHYFYNLFVSIIARLGVPVNQLIYILFPISFSVLLGIGTYNLIGKLFPDAEEKGFSEKLSLSAVFFSYFGSSFGWILSLIRGEEIGGESSFWANQPVSMNLNPPFAISLVIMIFTLLLVSSFLKKTSNLKAVGLMLLAGSLIGFKAYAGIILVGGLFTLGLIKFIFHRDSRILVISLFSGLISFVIVLSQGKIPVSLFEFSPLWLVDTMIDAGDRVGIPDLTSKRFSYKGDGRWLNLIVIEILSLLIFFAGNLGTRLVGLFAAHKAHLKNDLYVMVLSMMIISVIPTLVFVQKGNPWNIVQFLYYFLFFSGLFAAYAVSRLPILLSVLVLLITPISSIATFRSWLYPTPPAYLSRGENEALMFLSHQEYGVVLKHPFSPEMRTKFKDPYPLVVYADNSYVSASSGKGVYVEDVEQQVILNTDFAQRLKDSNRFFSEKDLIWSNNFLKSNNISYVYLPKIYQLPAAESGYLMKKIFENNEANIYEVVE